MTKRLALVAFWLLVSLSAAADTADGGLYLFVIPTDRVPESAAPLATGEAVLQVPNAQRTATLLEQYRLPFQRDDAGAIRIPLRPGLTFGAPPDAADLDNSFVVDFEEQVVAELIEAYRSEDGPVVDVESLADFVDRHITSKTYARGFDLASVVARSAQGDCTEHAVLLTALARGLGLPARVIIGTLVIEHDQGVGAFGHAWAEIYQDGRWQVADATRPLREPSVHQVFYLPLKPLRNETPAYRLDLMDLMVVSPSRVTLYD